VINALVLTSISIEDVSVKELLIHGGSKMLK